jgi:hypothetical protein
MQIVPSMAVFGRTRAVVPLHVDAGMDVSAIRITQLDKVHRINLWLDSAKITTFTASRLYEGVNLLHELICYEPYVLPVSKSGCLSLEFLFEGVPSEVQETYAMYMVYENADGELTTRKTDSPPRTVKVIKGQEFTTRVNTPVVEFSTVPCATPPDEPETVEFWDNFYTHWWDCPADALEHLMKHELKVADGRSIEEALRPTELVAVNAIVFQNGAAGVKWSHQIDESPEKVKRRY